MAFFFHIEDTSNPKAKAFLEYIKTLDFVSMDNDDTQIPQWQMNESQRRLDLVDKGEMKTRSWGEAKKDIFRK